MTITKNCVCSGDALNGKFAVKVDNPAFKAPCIQWIDHCPDHPRYRGKTKPRRMRGKPGHLHGVECKTCMAIWRKVKPKKKKKREIVQRHHITYDPEVTALIRQTEHWVLTSIQRLGKPYSRGFIHSLAVVIALHGPESQELTK